MPKLYANGLTALHVGDKPIKADKDGTIQVPVEHLDAALSHGCTAEPKTAPEPAQDLARRLAALEARVAVLETAKQ